jgi:type IV pilus assembly protein PilA
MARSYSKRRRGARGFSLIELLIVIAIILVIIGIALPRFNIAQMSARELAVQNEVRTINTAQVQYQSQFGRYATSMAELGPPASGAPGPAGADLIQASLASGEKDQYTFALTGTQQGYTLIAAPKVFNSSGRKSFYTDQSMTIRESMAADPANATSPEVK